MRPAGILLAIAVQRCMLDAFSALVPASGRCEWRAEWDAELWQVRRCADYSTGWKAEFEAARFCAGALPDAIEVRRIARAAHPGSSPVHRSAVFCLLILALVLACGRYRQTSPSAVHRTRRTGTDQRGAGWRQR